MDTNKGNLYIEIWHTAGAPQVWHAAEATHVWHDASSLLLLGLIPSLVKHLKKTRIILQRKMFFLNEIMSEKLVIILCHISKQYELVS